MLSARRPCGFRPKGLRLSGCSTPAPECHLHPESQGSLRLHEGNGAAVCPLTLPCRAASPSKPAVWLSLREFAKVPWQLSGTVQLGEPGRGWRWPRVGWDGVGALPLLGHLLLLQLWGKREDHSFVLEAVERKEGGSQRLMGSLLLCTMFQPSLEGPLRCHPQAFGSSPSPGPSPEFL